MPEAKKNEFEIWAQYNENVAKLVAEKAERLKDLAAAMRPDKVSYTLGAFVLDQMKNMTKLIEANLKAGEAKESSAAAAPKKRKSKKK